MTAPAAQQQPHAFAFFLEDLVELFLLVLASFLGASGLATGAGAGFTGSGKAGGGAVMTIEPAVGSGAATEGTVGAVITKECVETGAA